MNSLAWCTIAVLVIPAMLAAWQYWRSTDAHRLIVHYDAAIDGAKLLKEWCTWLATISTGSVGLAAFISADYSKLSSEVRLVVLLAIFSFTLCILFTATLLLALPSLVARLKKTEQPAKTNDLYEATAFHWAKGPFDPLFRIGYLAFLQYYFFLIGVAGFAIYAMFRAPL